MVNLLPKIIERTPLLLEDGFSQKKDLELLRLFVAAYSEGGTKAVKQRIETIINDILQEE